MSFFGVLASGYNVRDVRAPTSVRATSGWQGVAAHRRGGRGRNRTSKPGFFEDTPPVFSGVCRAECLIKTMRNIQMLRHPAIFDGAAR